MPLTATGQLVDQAQANGTAIAAFNVITLEHAEAIVAGAERAGRAVILQISENAVRFHHGRLAPIAAATTAVAELAAVPVAVHLDHVESRDLLHAVRGTGISSAMFDASTLDYAGNVAATAEAADWAHEHGLWLEAELGEVGGKDGAHAPGVRTDPAEAVEFVAATGVDALAVAVGSSHAMTDRTATLDLDLIVRLREALAVPLVLHGSSGVPDDDLTRAVRAGIVKVNVGTILNVAFTDAVRAQLDAGPVVDPRRYLAPAREAVAGTVAHLVTTIS
ncbi:class II fructose-bisphosphate aldolase [Plantactinospora solaniradicis]|uniref:Class II fructose-bisphosphate aldolase n=1 Tax=Plantactinospora solaniradicis TaxID=1723736 RepID=A0ABW1KLI1_9ACTN